MCTSSCLSFATAVLDEGAVSGKDVLEVGSRDVNGSVRPVVERLGPRTYIGVDIEAGSGVDELCDVSELIERYGSNAFDVVLSTELTEHVEDWRSAFRNMKGVVRPGGTLIVTTRSRGFPVHGYPWDYWRYEPEDMRTIFADFEILALERDSVAPGVFVQARKPLEARTEADLDDIELYSVLLGERSRDLDFEVSKARRLRFDVMRYAHEWRHKFPVRRWVRDSLGRERP
jgi:SAM-dependent methyltransferase